MFIFYKKISVYSTVFVTEGVGSEAVQHIYSVAPATRCTNKTKENLIAFRLFEITEHEAATW